MLGVADLREVIDRLIGPHRLTDSEMAYLVQNMLAEADLDDDGALSFAEFEHVIDKSPDFSRWGKRRYNEAIESLLENKEFISKKMLQRLQNTSLEGVQPSSSYKRCQRFNENVPFKGQIFQPKYL